jgi:HAMP domain-containing protein
LKRLIIREGERIIRHELGDAPVTLGRDPACDLYFIDQRLSRKHCRVEATPEGVRFEDLGSRNGSYLGSKRVDVVNLAQSDSVRMGGLFLSYEDDAPPEPAEDATVILKATPEEDPTVLLKRPPPEHTPRLLKREPAAPSPVGEDKTVILPARSDSPPKPPANAKPVLPKTRVLDVNTLAADADKGASDTLLLSPGAKPPRPTPLLPVRSVEPPPPPPMPEEGFDASHPGWLASLSWSAKLLFLVSTVAFVVYFVLAFPLVRTLGSALREESLRRGRALLSLTAAANGAAVGEGRIRDASVDRILREERVKEALLLDLDGKVLAPSSRADEAMTTIDGISAELGDIRTFYLGRRGSDYVMVEPLLHRSRRVGFAVLVYEAASASASWATAVLFLGFLVLLLGVITALVFGKRMTLEPLSSFGDDIEAVVKGDADYVPPQQGFAELSELARSVNRLIARSFTERASAPVPGRPLATPSPAAPPSSVGDAPRQEAESSSKRPITAAVTMTPDPAAARFWVDENFIVVRADDEAAALGGAAATGMEGKHIIEAVADQKLLEVILDTVNALDELPAAETTAELPGGSSFHVSASKEQGSTVVGLRKL